MKITLLVENHAKNESLKAEHGLSYFIEYGEERILFDTGQSDLLVHNAKQLGIDLTTTTKVVLSHGHYDHTDGLASLGELLSPNVTVYVHPKFDIERYSIKDPAHPKYIGISKDARNVITRLNLVSVTETMQLVGALWLSGEIPRHTNYEDTGGPFFLDSKGMIPDPIIDDMALWFTSDSGLVVLLGCAHAGIINTLDYAITKTGVHTIHAIIGGFHLVNANSERIDKTIIALNKAQATILSACHCTGENACNRMQAEFPTSFHPCGAGSIFEF